MAGTDLEEFKKTLSDDYSMTPEEIRSALDDVIELPMGHLGIAVVVTRDPAAVRKWENPLRCLTIEDLRKIWQVSAEANVRTWRMVEKILQADPLKGCRGSDSIGEGAGNQSVNLCGPVEGSAPFKQFSGALFGIDGGQQMRHDFFTTSDNETLVGAIAGDPYALGYLKAKDYYENQSSLRAVAIDSGDGPVCPTRETIRSGAYGRMARHLVLYVRKTALKRPDMLKFLEFLVKRIPDLVRDADHIPLSADSQVMMEKRFERIKESLEDPDDRSGTGFYYAEELQGAAAKLRRKTVPKNKAAARGPNPISECEKRLRQALRTDSNTK